MKSQISLVDKPYKNVPTEYVIMETIIAKRRPYLSAKLPKIAPPNGRATNAASNNVDVSVVLIANSF